jgi:diguanylate cyclase (GGDEF)-like protein
MAIWLNLRKIRFSNFSIKTKIFVPVIAGFVFLVVALGVLIANLEQEKTFVLKNIVSTQRIIASSDQLADLQNQIQQAVISYEFKKDQKDLEFIQQQDNEIFAVMGQMDSFLGDPEMRKLLESFKQNKQEAIKYRQVLIGSIQNGQSQAQIDQAYGAWMPKAQSLNEISRHLTITSASMLSQDITTFRKVIDEVIITYLAILLITAILIVLLYSYLKNLIIKPINRLTESTKLVTQGNLDWNIKIFSLDEIGKLSEAFNEMTLRLKGSYNDLRVLAFSDQLTGLPNRQALEQKLQLALAQAAETKTLVGVMQLDLDRFKKINDTFGHDTGDKVLKEVASRLTMALRSQDSVVRLGGDEFLIILPGIKSVANAVIVATKVLKAIEETMAISSRQLYVSGSVGVAIYPNDAEDLGGLLKAADIALYGAKASGRNRYNLYNKITDLRPIAQMELENDLRAALRNQQLKVFYQPLTDLQTGRVVAAEALLRWQHPTLGMLMPHEFIPLAEDCGIINAIGSWTLKTVCRAGKKWQTKLPNLQLAVNLSPRQFLEDNLENNIARILAETGLPAESLNLEITENLAMVSLERSKTKLENLARTGIVMSIDDFGTGYSSLSYIKHFPIHRIKIDRSFIRHIITDPQDTVIVKAIITMGHNLDLTVAAEGVETDTQWALLKSLGCDEAQGYFISRPLSEEEFTGWLEHPVLNQEQPAGASLNQPAGPDAAPGPAATGTPETALENGPDQV